jgi:hypothetical protein
VQFQRQSFGSVPPEMWLWILYISPFTIFSTFHSKHFALGQPSLPICLIHPHALYRQCLMEIVCAVSCLMKCQSEGTCNCIEGYEDLGNQGRASNVAVILWSSCFMVSVISGSNQ